MQGAITLELPEDANTLHAGGFKGEAHPQKWDPSVWKRTELRGWSGVVKGWEEKCETRN